MNRSGDRPIPMLAGVVLIVAGVLFLGYAFFQYASIGGDPSYTGAGWRDAYEMRDTARGMLLGLTLVVLGILVVVLRLRDRRRAPSAPREAEKNVAQKLLKVVCSLNLLLGRREAAGVAALVRYVRDERLVDEAARVPVRERQQKLQVLPCGASLLATCIGE